MNYTGKQSKQNIEPTQKVAQAPTVSVFADQRASTAMQLKQQQIMHAAHSPNVIQQMTAEEEPIQGEFENEAPTQLQEAPAAQPNNTGLPDNLKSGIENLSGYSMDDVKVHFNSDKPAQLNAHAYAQGTDIHVAPGQEQHLPHEAWHVVQQKQGRVQPTKQMKAGVPVNDDAGLENEADVMGIKAMQFQSAETIADSVQMYKFNNPYTIKSTPSQTMQLLTDEKLVNTKNFGKAYYQFDYDSSGNIDDFSNNRATQTPVGADPVDAGSHVNLDEGTGSGQGEMRSGKDVDIASGTRSQHFSIADRLVDGTPDDRKGTYTWHHLTPEYEMVLVDMGVHAAFGHKGGKSFWK